LTPDRMHIRRAVIPAAGLGTRMRPLTSIAPKEMLPLGRKPTVEYIIDELHEIGISDIIFVVSPPKTGIRDYFGDSACHGMVSLQYVIQDPLKGLADAILQAEGAVAGEHFVVALGDTIILSSGKTSPLARAISSYQANPAFAALVVERVPVELSSKYGMVKPVESAVDDAFEIDGLIEKPQPSESPSDFAIGGRYIFDPGIFDVIRRTPPGVGGELQITDSIRLAVAEGKRVWCAPVTTGEKRYDIGSLETFCEAFAAVCMLDAELAQSMLSALQGCSA
jgi:UTP--glucose-1-phosphate uridylyltransferase